MNRDPEQPFTKDSKKGTSMFNAKAEAYAKNRGPAVVSAARIHRPDGPPIRGLWIRQPSSKSWIAIPEAEAVGLANQILDVIEAQRGSGKASRKDTDGPAPRDH